MFWVFKRILWGFPGGSDATAPTCQCRRPGFDPWVGKVPWRRAWQPTPGFLPGEAPWLEEPAGYSPWGHIESDTTEQLSTAQNKEHFKKSACSGGSGLDPWVKKIP